jgi:hypothetical protein
MTFVFHVLGVEAPQPYDRSKVYNEFALCVNAGDLNEAKSRKAAWDILVSSRGELERKSHHITCTDKCRCSKKLKRAKRILTHAIRQVQFPIYRPEQWPAIS